MTARKFFYGDTVGITIDKPLHYGHTAKIDGTLIRVIDMRRQHFLMSIGSPKKGVDSALDTLSERERYILEARHDLTGDGRLTLADLAKALGVTRERVRQIEARAMKKLLTSRGK